MGSIAATECKVNSTRRYLSLRAQVSIGLVLFGLMALALYFSMVSPAVRKHMTGVEREKLQLHADSTALQIDSALTRAARELELIAKLPALQSLDPAAVNEALNSVEKTSSSFRGFLLIGQSGPPLVKSLAADDCWALPENLEKVRPTTTFTNTRVMDCVVASNHIDVVISSPVGTALHQTKAVLSGSLGAIAPGADYFRAIFQAKIPDAWRVLLWNADGRLLASSRKATGAQPRMELAQESWSGVSARVARAGWTIDVQLPAEAIAAQVAVATRPVTTAFLTSLAAFLGIALLAVRRFVRPLQSLTEALNRFGREGQVDAVQPGGSGEIAGAIEAFNRVASERREAEEARRASEARFRHIFESQMIGILFWNRDGAITDANEAFLNLVGYNREDLDAGKVNWSEMTPPEYAHLDVNALKEMTLTGVCTPFEKEYICKDGRRIAVLIGAAGLTSGANAGVCFVLDISLRKQGEETRESLRRLAADLTASLTLQQMALILARECRQLFDYHAFFFDLVDEPEGGHTTVHAEDTPHGEKDPIIVHSPAVKFSQPVQPLFQGEPILLNRAEDPAQTDLRAWGFSNRRSRSLMFTPIRWEGQCIGVLSVQSYTARKYNRRDLELLQLIADQCGSALARVKSEAALQKSRQFVQQIAELMPNVLYVFDLELQRSTFTNREVALSLGYSKEEITRYGSAFIQEVMHPDDRPRFAEYVKRLRALPDGAVSEFDYRIRRKNGQYCWFRSRDTVFARTETGEAQQVIGTATDITQRKQAEEEIRSLNETLEQRVIERTAQFEAANKELEAFSYSVSHDLRAPLRHISGFANMLRSLPSLTADPSGSHYTTVIANAARRMGNLIDDLLVFSRMGRTEMKRARVALMDLVHQIRADLPAEAERRGITWKIAELPDVQGDPAMLRLVLQNLIDNAVKYTGPRSPALIEIGSSAEGEMVVVFVRDNGVGFEMKYADKLFGVFQRLHRDEEFEGTGIGLANVRRIIARHGGRTWAESEVDKGATFYFSLPKNEFLAIRDHQQP